MAFFSERLESPRVNSNMEKKRWACALWVKNPAVLCENHRESHANLKKKHILPVWRLSGSELSRWFIAPLGVLFVMKTLEDER